MPEFLDALSLFAIALTAGTYLFGVWVQSKVKSHLCNPILISAVLVIVVLLLTGYPVDSYKEATKGISWLLTPATVCFALPLYEQLKVLKKNLPAILAGVIAGTITSLAMIFGLCLLFTLDKQLAVSLLPKSITTAMGTVLSAQNGGIESLTTAVIMVTGIMGALTGPALCKLFRITNPIARGVAYGTASHVVGTSKATEIDPVSGAVSTLCLVSAGIVTAVIFPLVCMLYP